MSLLLSFCISTFNRSHKVCNLVNEVLKYQGDEIEVVVSDNCSSDNTIDELSRINDHRLRVLKNSKNIGAIPNYIKSISAGKGQYVLFCTDKDTVKSTGISCLVSFLKLTEQIVGGLCSMNVHKQVDNVFFNTGVDGILNIGYLSRHPTGYFFKGENLKALLCSKDYSDFNDFGVFPFEFIIAELCMQGKTVILNTPLFYIESMEDVSIIKSYSYSGIQNNLYFTPGERFKMFRKYVNHISILQLSSLEKNRIVRKSFRSGLFMTTVWFKSMLANKVFCDHYGIQHKYLRNSDLISNALNFSFKFVWHSDYSNLLNRIIICFQVYFELLFKLKKVKLN
jgi:glycosyltransferase involved in cell wall biosynthesis